MPLVSVITPVFNAIRWLPETLESVGSQTLSDWEHILVDDGSTDGSVELIERAAAADPRVRLLRMSENSGPAKACNKAVEASTGRYLAFLDADDLWLPKKLERCIVWMQKNGYVFVYHDYRQISQDGNRIGKLVRGPDRLNVLTLHTRRGAGCLSVVVDHEGAPGFHFPIEDRSLPQDFPAWLWLIHHGHDGYRLPEDLGRYRLTDHARSSNKYRCALRVWRIYRHEERLPLRTAINWWTQYAWNAFWLHRRARPRYWFGKQQMQSAEFRNECASPVVSIITPVYNSSRWLVETLASVRAQRFKDWEHILVDDGSTDGSVELIERAAAADPRIRLLRMQENGGPAKARNKAMASAKGRFLAFLDADDLWVPEKLERCVPWMQKNGYVFGYHDYREISHDGQRIGELVRGPERLDVRSLHTRRGAGCLTVVVDRAGAPGFHFPVEDRKFPEDFVAWLWLLRHGHVGHRLDEDLARYRLTEGSYSSNKRKAAFAVWRFYRYEEGLPLPRALNWWARYAWNGLWLHRYARPH